MVEVEKKIRDNFNKAFENALTDDSESDPEENEEPVEETESEE